MYGLHSSNESIEAEADDEGIVSTDVREPVISVRKACQNYGSKSKPRPVLVNLDMTVAKGTIYGLLGASGCGKTTLISCLVGKRRLNSGEIWVLRENLTIKGSTVPSKRVGYMPQEIALFREFTIKETMMYFGWIFDMKTDEILERLQFLIQFLNLPSQNDLLKNLSGGQQRRVSFAVALIHDPELLILDEPTVGVDPLLRQSIWNYLVKLTEGGRKTVILTTHYIEEASRAHTIGLMRSGKILVEESPPTLLSMFRCSKLEEVFLTLIRKEGTSKREPESNISESSLSELPSEEKTGTSVSQESAVERFSLQPSKLLITDNVNSLTFNLTTRGKMQALLLKNTLQWRNRGMMLFVLILPVIQTFLMCITIGRDPKGLKLAIVNLETNGTECNFEPGCNLSRLSCRYLDRLDKSILREYYSDRKSAIEAVRSGYAWGVVYFTENFTDAFMKRMELDIDIEDETLDQSEIRIWLDMSNEQISKLLSRDLFQSYRDFSQNHLKDCGKNSKVAGTPILFEEPIYGTRTPSYTDFIAAGGITSVLFGFCITFTSMILISERVDGLLDRSIIAGVSFGEIMFSSIITQFMVLCVQSTLVIFVITTLGLTFNGNMFLAFLIVVLQGICGMCLGFAIATISESMQGAMQLTLGSFYPLILLSGVLWPIEGMPAIFRYISYFLPLTQAATSVRAILLRGWGIDKPEVYLGFISTLLWIILLTVTTLMILKFKRR